MPKAHGPWTVHTDRIDVLTFLTYVLLIGYVVNVYIQRLIHVIQTTEIVTSLVLLLMLVKSYFFFWGLLECNVVQSLPKHLHFTLRQTYKLEYKRRCAWDNFV